VSNHDRLNNNLDMNFDSQNIRWANRTIQYMETLNAYLWMSD